MNKYTFLWSNAHQLFYMRGNIDSYVRYSKIPFNSAEHVLQVSHENKMTCYLGTEDLERYVFEGKLFLNYPKADKYIKKAREQCTDHQKFYQKLKKIPLSKQSNTKLLVLWQGLMENYAHSVAYFRSTQEEPSRALVEKVAHVVSLEELNILLLSPDLDDINKESIAWQKVIKKGFTRKLALAHINSFPWLFQNVLSYEETVDELEQRASNPTPRDVREEKEELRKKQEPILAKYPKLARDIAILHRLALLRPEVKAAWGATGFYAAPLLVEISKRFRIDARTLTFLYRHEDVETLLNTGIPLTQEEIDDRKLCTTYVIRNQKLLDFVGKEAEKIEKEELGDLNEHVPVTEIKGMSARPGKVKGVVHILSVNDPVATKKFRASFRGGILVTTMTQPNIVDIAERASAIITDEGGMLCHAAIISREFGIPCIVGTHKATQVLKDGDLVEVDADRGIIKIIK